MRSWGRRFPPIVILYYGIADVHGPAAPYPFEIGGLLECDGGYCGVGFLFLCQVHAQVLLLRTHEFRIAPVAYTPRHEYGRRIAGSERLEGFQRRAERGRDVAEEEFGIYLHLGYEHVRVDVLLHVFVETVHERFYVLRLHGKSRGIHVPSEILQQVGTRLYRLVEVEAERSGPNR